MLIPYTKLSEKALRAIIEEYITREGTEYGVKEYTFEQNRTNSSAITARRD